MDCRVSLNPANGHLVVKSTDPELAKSTQVASKMVVVCDVSGSMRGNIVKCKRAAAAVVHTANAAQLPQGTVYIVFFDHNIQLCVDATDSDAVEQIGLARTGGGTKYGPVIKLLQVQEPSSVLFITDGVPQDAQDAYALIDTFAKQTSAVVLPVFFAPEGTYATSMTPRAMQVLKRLACNTDQDPKVVEDCDKLVELIEQSIWAAGQDQTGAISVDDGVPMLARVFGNGEATIVVTMQPVTNFAPTSQVALEIGGQRIPCVVTDAAPDHTTQQLIETTTLVSMLDQANNALHCRAPRCACQGCGRAAATAVAPGDRHETETARAGPGDVSGDPEITSRPARRDHRPEWALQADGGCPPAGSVGRNLGPRPGPKGEAGVQQDCGADSEV
jgi:uncharacterized protein YegL